jgi:endonuclease G
MKLKFIVGCLLAQLTLIAAPVIAQQPAPSPKYCDAQLPFGTPAPAADVLCRAGYALDYDPVAKLPVWDAHVLTPAHAIGCAPRSNAFAADQSLSADERAKPSDYLHTGYDIGHMSPDADFTWNEDLERQSFILSNMAPQLPGLNRQTWKYLEEDIRAWVWSGRTLWIITGPVYPPRDHERIGADRVVVPTAFWKVIVDEKTGEYLSFLMPNEENLGADLSPFLLPWSSIDRQLTGVKIVFPKGAKASSAVWPVPAGFAAAKKVACK